MRGTISVFLIALVLAVAFYFMPQLVIHDMREAIKTHDQERFSQHVDYESVRESIKESLYEKISTEVAKKEESDMATGIATVMAAAIIGPMIDSLITPESIGAIIKGDKPNLDRQRQNDQPQNNDNNTDTKMWFESFSQFVVVVNKKGKSDDPVYLVFHRYGLFTWKLSEIHLKF